MCAFVYRREKPVSSHDFINVMLPFIITHKRIIVINWHSRILWLCLNSQKLYNTTDFFYFIKIMLSKNKMYYAQIYNTKLTCVILLLYELKIVFNNIHTHIYIYVYI